MKLTIKELKMLLKLIKTEREDRKDDILDSVLLMAKKSCENELSQQYKDLYKEKVKTNKRIVLLSDLYKKINDFVVEVEVEK